MKTNVSILAGVLGGIACIFPLELPLKAAGSTSPRWQAPSQWRRFLRNTVRGTLLVDDNGVEFRSPKFHQRWAYIDIHSFELSANELTLNSYQNRPWREPGERNFRFSWTEPMPPDIAAEITARVGKPVRNGIPTANPAALAQIPAHRRLWSGGSNGVLRLKDDGIDYVTGNGDDSRTWRWTDIRTIANPDPYELRVTGYREIFEFDLKQPLRRAVFERMWDRLYAGSLNLSEARR
jgi:hypothetical protein